MERNIREIKEWLSRAYKMDEQIASKLEMIDRWEELECKSTATYGGSCGGRPSGYANRIEEYGIKIADAKEEIEYQLSELVEIRREIEQAVWQVQNPTLRVLLEQRYLVCKKWEEISIFMDYDIEHLKYRLHKRALNAVREKTYH